MTPAPGILSLPVKHQETLPRGKAWGKLAIAGGAAFTWESVHVGLGNGFGKANLGPSSDPRPTVVGGPSAHGGRGSEALLLP